MPRFRTIDEARAAVAHISFLSRPAAIAKVGVDWKLSPQTREAQQARFDDRLAAIFARSKIERDAKRHAELQDYRRRVVG
jgi:hypothetical protein